MKRLLLLAAAVLVGLAGHAQKSIDMDVVKKFMQQKQGVMTRNDIAPNKAVYSVQDGQVLMTYRDDFLYDEYEYYLYQKTTSVQDLGEWYPHTMTNIEVDWNYMPIEVINMKWDSNDWINDTKRNIEYDEVGFIPLVKEEVYQRWEETDWVNEHKYVYDYDPIVTLIIKDWNGNTWENHYLYTYEASLTETTVLLQYWQGGAWQNQEKMVVNMNASGNYETVTIMEWINATWTNEEQDTYEYDNNNYLTKVTKRSWDGNNWSNTNYQTINYENDGMGNSIHATLRFNGNAEHNTDITMYYNEGESVDYKNIYEITMDYIDLTQVTEQVSGNCFNIYPNPTEGMMEIHGEGFVKAELYNLSGQKVLSSEQPTLHAEGLSAGAYLMKIQRADGKMETQKVLVK